MLIEKYRIAPAFLSRYFERNVERRFAEQLLEFMLWRRGKFIPPHQKDHVNQQFFIEEIENFYEKGQLNLPQIQFSITTRCNLRCRYCNAFMPKFSDTAEHVELTPVEFERDLLVLTGAINAVRRFMLLGGEPLLHAGFSKILDVAAVNPKINIIEIVTNGTIVPNTELLTVAKKHNHKVYFHISNYSKNDDLNPVLKHDAIITMLKKHDIKYQISSDVVWAMESALTDRHYDDARVKVMFADCWMKRTLEIKKGKIAVCPKASSGYELAMVNDTYPGEIVNLREDGSDIRKRIIDFYHRDFFEACRCCVRLDETVAPAEQIKRR
jgi:organic radical activating enzyme